MVEVESEIFLIVERASGPRLTVVQTVIFELRFLPYVWAHPDGNPRRPDGWSNLPLNWTWKESEADRSLRGVRTGCWDIRTGCWDVRTDASWNRSFSIHWCVRTESHVVRMVWHVVRTDGTVDRWVSGRDDTSSERLTGNRLFWLQNLLKLFWIAESLVKQHLYIQVILSKQNEANNTNKLPIWPFWDKNHLTGLEIHFRSK
jgi:hypothetical protein